MGIESIKLVRAEDLSEPAKAKYNVRSGIVKIVTTRNSAAETTVEKVTETPFEFFKNMFK